MCVRVCVFFIRDVRVKEGEGFCVGLDEGYGIVLGRGKRELGKVIGSALNNPHIYTDTD